MERKATEMTISSFPTLRADSFTTLPIWAQLMTRLANIWLLTLFSQTAVRADRLVHPGLAIYSQCSIAVTAADTREKPCFV